MARFERSPKQERISVVVVGEGRESYGDPFWIVEDATGRRAKLTPHVDGTVVANDFENNLLKQSN
jgi:hypothetical protein